MAGKNTNATSITQIQHDVLTGSMLGDGHMRCCGRSTTPILTIKRQLNDIDYLKWERDVFDDLISNKSVYTGSRFDKRTNKTYYNCSVQTRAIPAFSKYLNDWYPNAKKVVPTNLELNSQIIAVWFADDGYLRVSDAKQPRITTHFATNGFSKDEVFFLKELLDKKYNTEFIVSTEVKDKQFVIIGADYQSRILLEDIDSVFPPMKRKSDKWRNSLNWGGQVTQTKPYKYEHVNNILNIIKNINVKEKFSMYELCNSTGLFYIRDYDNISNRWYPHNAVKRFCNKLLDSKIISTNDPGNKVLKHSILQVTDQCALNKIETDFLAIR